jgi:hypothetical protein
MFAPQTIYIIKYIRSNDINLKRINYVLLKTFSSKMLGLITNYFNFIHKILIQSKKNIYFRFNLA